MKIMSKKNRDEIIYNYFSSLLREGYSIMEATYSTMAEFGISSNATIYNIRKRHDERETKNR